MNDYRLNKGFTFIELLIVIAIIAIVIAAITFFIGSIFTINREQREQSLITEDARIQMQRISEAIRNARSVMPASGEKKFWLGTAEDYEIVFYSNIDGDDKIERVRYYLEGTDLKRSITKSNPDGEYPPGKAITSILSRSIRNLEENKPLFTYYAAGSGSDSVLDTATMDKESVKRIGINLVVNVNPNQKPGAAYINSQVTPRRPTDLVTGSFDPIEIQLPQPSSGDPAVLIWLNSGDPPDTDYVSMNVLNSGRLATYHDNHPVVILYDNPTEEWRVLVGVWMGEDYAVDEMTLTELTAAGCLEQDLLFMLEYCEERTVEDSETGEVVTYQPVITYTDSYGIKDYVMEITPP